MNSRLKALLPALVAALALTAVSASTAAAQFTSNKEHTLLSGSQKTGTNNVFTAGEGFGGVTCENATVSGTMTSTNDATMVLRSSNSTCKDSFGRTVHVDSGITTAGPPHVVHDPMTHTHTGPPGNTVHTKGVEVTTTTSGGSVVCTTVIKNSQTNSGVTYTNLGGTSGMEITVHMTNVITTTSGGFFNCGISNGEHKTGTYDGTIVITGKDTTGAAASISRD